MAKAKKKSRRSGGRKGRLVVGVMAAVLVLCGASIAVGVMNWFTRSYGDEITDDLRIEVLNGTGENGVGRMVARALMKKKVDVLFVDNADRFDYEETVIVARKRKPGIGSLAEMIGCRRVEQIKENSSVDATLIVGGDYRGLNLVLGPVSSLSE
jgi:hypothetical protein